VTITGDPLPYIYEMKNGGFVPESANGATYKSQGQARSASPLVTKLKFASSPEKGGIRCVFRPFRPQRFSFGT